MKALLKAVQAALKAGMSGIRKGDVFITPHEAFLPRSQNMPCLGIKDGGVSRRELTGGAVEENLEVVVIVFTSLRKEHEAVILGDSKEKGVLDLADAVRGILDRNLLDLPGMEYAWCAQESGSEMFEDESRAIQRKLLAFQYTREVA